MGQLATEGAALVGRRVVWRGPAQRGFLAAAYRRAVAAGAQRPPAPTEQLELRPDDTGTITELVAVTSIGHQYAIQFDNGYEIEIVLPSRTVTVIN